MNLRHLDVENKGFSEKRKGCPEESLSIHYKDARKGGFRTHPYPPPEKNYQNPFYLFYLTKIKTINYHSST